MKRVTNAELVARLEAALQRIAALEAEVAVLRMRSATPLTWVPSSPYPPYQPPVISPSFPWTDLRVTC